MPDRWPVDNLSSLFFAGGIALVLTALIWRGLFWRWLWDRENAAHLTAIATLGLVIVTAGLVLVAMWQWRTLENTDATLRHTLTLAHRPWVGIEKIEIRNWPTQVNGQINFDLAVWLKNVGKSPAVVLVDAVAILSTEPWAGPQKKKCTDTKAEVQRNGFGEQWTVLPDQVWPFHKSILLKTPVSEIQQNLGGKYVARFAGCVLYKSTFDDALYMTSFVGTTSVEDPRHPLPRDESNPLIISDRTEPKDHRLVIKALSMAGEPPQ